MLMLIFLSLNNYINFHLSTHHLKHRECEQYFQTESIDIFNENTMYMLFPVKTTQFMFYNQMLGNKYKLSCMINKIIISKWIILKCL